MLKHFIKTSTFLLFSLTLLACGNAGIGGGISSADLNGGSGQFPTDPNNPGDGSGSGDPDAPAETIGVRIETNTDEGLKERTDIPKDNISIIALDHDFKENRFITPPNFITQRSTTDGYQLEFDDLYIEQANIVVEVITGKDAQGKNITLYGSLYTVGQNNSVTVNIISHYVLKKFFDTLENSDDLDALIPCNNCENHQVLAKANLLVEVSKMAQEYEISIPANLSIAGSLDFLDEQTAFRAHIETAVAEVSRSISPFAKGTPRAYGLESSARLQYASNYHSLWFALSLNDLLPENNQNEIMIATETSAIVENVTENGSSSLIYPSYNQFTTLLDTRKELLSSVVPFTRESLTISQDNNYSREASSPSNFLATLIPNNASVSTEGFLLNTRPLSQQVPKENGEGIGWQFNPIFSKLYKANEYERDTDISLPIDFEDLPNTSISPTWLLGANYSTGGSFNLTQNASGFIRGAQREDLNIFSWEIHGQETHDIASDDEFSIDQLHNKTYGVINYSLNIEDGSASNSDIIIELFGETEEWEISNNTILFDQPSPHFRSYKRSRNQDNTVNTPLNDLILGANSPRTISAVKSESYLGEKNRGLLTLDGALSPKGHSTLDGKHLAFVYRNGLGANGQRRGRGITVATELSARSPIFPDITEENGEIIGGARYTLSGNSFGINAEHNTLRNLNNSTLILSDRLDGDTNNDCYANLEGVSVFIKHTVGTGITQNKLSRALTENTARIQSQACTLNGNSIEIKFNALNNANPESMLSQALTLKGFISPKGTADSTSTTPGNVMSLLWIQADNLGLVFATKDQQLSPSFD